MNLGLCGPIDTQPLREYLHPGGEIPDGLGGSPVSALAKAALEKGWRVTIFSLDPTVTSEVILTGSRGLKICFGPFRARHRARDLFRSERAYLQEAIRREKPDIVHAHWTYEFALGAMASGVPTLVTAHDRPLRILRWDRSPYRLVRAVMAADVARRARRMTAVSEPVADHFRRFLRRAPQPQVIPNAIDSRWFREFRQPASGPFSFASVLTGWGGLKNGATLLQAFAMVRREMPWARLLLYGHDHGANESAQQWAAARGLEQGVSFLGHVDAETLRRQLQQQAHALVHPSLEESFSMTVAEAMASSIPVIAAQQGAAIVDTSNAILTDGKCQATMAADMLRLANDAPLRAALASRGSNTALSFRAAHVLEQYAAVYRSL